MSCCSCSYYISLIVLILLAIAASLKIFMKLTTGWCRSQSCLVGKTAIVTGANTGIGYETALDLAKRGAKVILACRRERQANEARDRIIQATGNVNVHVKLVDLSSLDSVRTFAHNVNTTVDRLDILVNNAGAGGLPDRTTDKDGLQLLMQVNYFAMFLLTNFLIGLLKKSAPSRVVIVSSAGARLAKLDLGHLNKFTGQYGTYFNSKLCDILFTIELARRLTGSGVAAYSLHPGAISTDIFRHAHGLSKYIIQFFCLFFKTPLEGAQTSIHLAVANDIDEKSNGGHFEDCRLVPHYSTVAVPGLAKDLWTRTMEILKLTDADLQF